MSHTPGPWTVNPHKAQVDVSNADAPICQMLWPTQLRSQHETRANARLIASAPELLKALDDMYEHAEWSTPQGEAAFRAARHAIAKATGGAQ